MKIIEPGHIYNLDWLDLKPEQSPNGHNQLVFVNREKNPHPGTQTQEVIRVLINRTQHCDNCLRWEGNDLIIHHLRMALVLHEARALGRKTEKNYIKPELIITGSDGHFWLQEEETK